MPTATDPSRDAARRALPRLGLTARVFVGATAIVVAVLGAALFVAQRSLRRDADLAARRGLEQTVELVAQFLSGRQRSLAGGARVFVQGPYFRSLVAAQRLEDVLDQAIEAAEQLEADWVFITDGRGRLIAKSDEPGAAGEALGGVPLVAGALRGQTTSGFGVSRDSVLFQAVAVPITLPDGVPIGALVATRVVDAALARDVRAATGDEVLFYALDDAGRAHVSATTLPPRAAPGILAASVRARPRAEGLDVDMLGAPHVALGGAATTAGGSRVGGWVVLRSREAAGAGIGTVRASFLVAAVVGVALALLAAWAAAWRVVRPVERLVDAARRAASGDYAPLGRMADAPDDAGIGEIASLGAAFQAVIDDVRERAALDAVRLRGGEPAPEPLPALLPAPAGSAMPGAGSAADAPRGRPATLALLPGARAVRQPRPSPAPIAPVAPAAPAAPALLAGRYALEAVVGAGGIGRVLRATDRLLGDTVAVKLLRPEVVAADPRALDRFKDELRLARRLAHPNIVRVHDFGESDGTPFLTMEYVPGPSLAALLRAGGALPTDAVVAVARQLARALAAAHAEGIVHGDVKPGNLLVGPGGVLKVTDFGLARVVRTPGASAHAAGAPRIAGAVVGTPAYMAPELLVGAAPDARSDLYAAGMVLHECLSGLTPFDADTPMAFFAHKLETAFAAGTTSAGAPPRGVAPPRAPASVLGALLTLVQQLVAAAPTERPASARAVLVALQRIHA